MSTKTGRIKQTDKDKAVTFIRIAVYMRLSKTDETMQEEKQQYLHAAHFNKEVYCLPFCRV